MKLIERYNITDIIIVHDLDNIKGIKTRLLTCGQFKSFLRRMNNNKILDRVNIKYIPVIYAAESIMLYHLYSFKCGVHEIVSSWNTNELQLALVKYALNLDINAKGKDIIDLVDRKCLINNLQKILNSDEKYNKEILSLLLEDLNIEKTLTGEEMILLLDEIGSYFEEKVINVGDLLCINGKSYSFYKEDKCLKVIRETLQLSKETTMIPFSSVSKQGREEIYEVIERYL